MFKNCLSAYIVFHSTKRVVMRTDNFSDMLSKFHLTEISVYELNSTLLRWLVEQERDFMHWICDHKAFSFQLLSFDNSHLTLN